MLASPDSIEMTKHNRASDDQLSTKQSSTWSATKQVASFFNSFGKEKEEKEIRNKDKIKTTENNDKNKEIAKPLNDQQRNPENASMLLNSLGKNVKGEREEEDTKKQGSKEKRITRTRKEADDQTWIAELLLTVREKKKITTGQWLTSDSMTAANRLLQKVGAIRSHT